MESAAFPSEAGLHRDHRTVIAQPLSKISSVRVLALLFYLKHLSWILRMKVTHLQTKCNVLPDR